MKTTTSTEKPAREEINSHVLKLVVGVMAIALPILTNVLVGDKNLLSISESYWRGGWAQIVFIGILFAIASFLFAYNGKTTTEMILSKIASIAAIGVALFPCDCDCTFVRTDKPIRRVADTMIECKEAFFPIPYVHFICAAVMFAILAYFCYAFRYRALRPKGDSEIVYGAAKFRAAMYLACGIAIVTVMVSVAADSLFKASAAMRGPIATTWNEFVFWAETTGLVAFGIAWLLASRTIPIVTNNDERYSLSPFDLQKD